MESAVCFHQQWLPGRQGGISVAAVLGKELTAEAPPCAHHAGQPGVFYRLLPRLWLRVKGLSLFSLWHRIGVIHPSVPQTPVAVTAPMVSAAQVGARQNCAELRDSGDLADV